MMRPSSHAAFFSSLQQVEKRLASEKTCSSNPPKDERAAISKSSYCHSSSSSSLGSPLYLQYQNPNMLSLQGSDPPLEFLSDSPDLDFNSRCHSHGELTKNKSLHFGGDEIEKLCSLLGLVSMSFDETSKMDVLEQKESQFGDCCSDSFFSKVGVEAPKCDKERRRLENWINFFSKTDVRTVDLKEPFRLAHLLIGKAAASNKIGDCCLKFPEAAKDFLQQNPPSL